MRTQRVKLRVDQLDTKPNYAGTLVTVTMRQTMDEDPWGTAKEVIFDLTIFELAKLVEVAHTLPEIRSQRAAEDRNRLNTAARKGAGIA